MSFAKMRLIIGGRQQIGKLLITNAFGNADVRRRKKMRGGQKFGLEMVPRYFFVVDHRD